jgi:hypothetical protein
MASTYLTRTFSSSGTSDKIWTWSSWIKRSEVTGEAAILTAGSSARDFIRFEASTTIGALRVRFSNGSADVTTNRRFRDTSGWYHLVVAVDTTQATASNRIKIYINGVQENSFSSSSYPSQNYVTKIGGGYVHNIGNDSEQTVPYFDGSMSHVHFIDGTAYDASAFGEYDANGVWKIKTSPSVTYGTNGFFILKDGNSVTDQSGNSNNWTVGGGTLTNTEDNPSNVFATLNPLNSFYSGATFSNGNNRVSLTGGTYAAVSSTLGFNSGKWYAEFKAADATNWVQVGIVAQNPTASGQPLGYFSDSYGYIGGTAAGGVNSLMNNDSNTSYASTYGNGDIISVAVDCDNNKLYFGLNGTWLNSGNPESGATGTGAAFTISSSPTSGFYYFAVGNYSGSETPDWEANFGNGYFGTTAVASAGTNASGIGIFEYDVPTGYTALSTKGLNL